MRYTATATVKKKLSATTSVRLRISALVSLKTNSPIGETCPDYDLIDGGTPGTVYVPINGFNLIDGGTP